MKTESTSGIGYAIINNIPLLQKIRIIDARKLGYTYDAIVEMEHVSFRQVSRILTEAGVVGKRKFGNIVKSEPKQEQASLHIDELIPICNICKVQDSDIGYFRSMDKDFCPQCLNKLSIADLKALAVVNFEAYLKELFT